MFLIDDGSTDGSMQIAHRAEQFIWFVSVTGMAVQTGVRHRIIGDRHVRVRSIGWDYIHVAVDDTSRLASIFAATSRVVFDIDRMASRFVDLSPLSFAGRAKGGGNS